MNQGQFFFSFWSRNVCLSLELSHWMPCTICKHAREQYIRWILEHFAHPLAWHETILMYTTGPEIGHPVLQHPLTPLAHPPHYQHTWHFLCILEFHILFGLFSKNQAPAQAYDLRILPITFWKRSPLTSFPHENTYAYLTLIKGLI